MGDDNSNYSDELLVQLERHFKVYLSDFGTIDVGAQQIARAVHDIIMDKIITTSIIEMAQEQFDTEPNRKKQRKARTPRDDDPNFDLETALASSEWARLLNNANISDPKSWAGRTFRRRFRVPYPLYRDVLMPLVHEHNLFDIKDATKIKIKAEYRLMCSLRMLGRGECADTASELSKMAENTCYHIHKRFINNFVTRCFDSLVYLPKGDHMQKILRRAQYLGFPGMVGSGDCTHLIWDKCPATLTHLAKGKEGRPSLAFLLIVDNSRFIMYCNSYQYGARNDKTIGNDECSVLFIVVLIFILIYSLFFVNSSSSSLSYFLPRAQRPILQEAKGWTSEGHQVHFVRRGRQPLPTTLENGLL
jgi:hypothetical protein